MSRESAASIAFEKFHASLALAEGMSAGQRQELLSKLQDSHAWPKDWALRCAHTLEDLSRSPELASDESFWRKLLDSVESAWPRSSEQALIQRKDSDSLLGELYRNTLSSAVRGRIARFWATMGTEAALRSFAEAMMCQPPAQANDIAVAYVPLFQHSKLSATRLFPSLLQCLGNPTAAACTLDLANYLYVEKVTPHHVCWDVRRELGELLENIAQRLQRLVETGLGSDDGVSPQTMVRDSAPLVVSLCNTLARLGDKELSHRLRTAVALPHRKIQCEAAYALASLEDPEGVAILLKLCADVGARTRALAYLADLGRFDEAPAPLRTEEAQSLGRLADWLAEPMRFGIPPQELDVLETATLFWPGAEQPEICRVVRFCYRFAAGEGPGVALASPHLDYLPLQDGLLDGPDLLSLFAGRALEHPEIWSEGVGESAKGRLSPTQEQAFYDKAKQAGLSRVKGERVGQIFSTPFWIANAEKEGAPVWAAVLGESVMTYPRSPSPRPLALHAEDIASLVMGKTVLQTFNPDFAK